jgi:hypothetical protein
MQRFCLLGLLQAMLILGPNAYRTRMLLRAICAYGLLQLKQVMVTS